ncbi:hypothetical protein [Paenibacillus abyssi]|uniref:Uncharacterized protein n=1 Tax=Paenibacillus abyssi TaxID=1340531 RepID=A0A917LF32_9BACL|nr:hypothetical protein [Paenibacillus abyssi]GGG17528.1 hypothetical protein GCM10010916_37960 [Paenibacillus abyssi]
MLSIFVASILAGAFGGILNALHKKSAIELPRFVTSKVAGKVLKPGIVRNILIGMGAGIVAVQLLRFLPIELDIFQFTAIAVLGGFSGTKLLARNAERLSEQTEKIVEEIISKMK